MVSHLTVHSYRDIILEYQQFVKFNRGSKFFSLFEKSTPIIVHEVNMDKQSQELMEDIYFEEVIPSSIKKGAEKKISTCSETRKTELSMLLIPDSGKKIVLDSLQSIYGEDFKLNDATKFKDKGNRHKKNYWQDRGTLIVQPAVEKSNPINETEEDIFRRYSINRLKSYGFPEKHSEEALKECGNDTDKALEFLYSKYFWKTSNDDTKNANTILEQHTMNELLQMREDEQQVLESIYEDAFEEKEKNVLWCIKLKVELLKAIYKPKEEPVNLPPKGDKFEMKKMQMCRNFLRGNCKFGDRCWYSHEKDEKKKEIKTEEKSDLDSFFVEVRFPKDSVYPYAPPMIFLKVNEEVLTTRTTLQLMKFLASHAAEEASNGMPTVYAVLDLLNNENELKEFLDNDKTKFPDSKKSLIEENTVNQNSNSNENNLNENIITEFDRNALKGEFRSSVKPEVKLAINKKLVNRFVDKQNDKKYRNMLTKRRTLPAWDKMTEILETIENSQVTVISGDTGCGKSTQVPQFLLDNWLHESSKLENINSMEHVEIICTQPRRLAAIGVASRVADERCESVGQSVGYQIRLENKISNDTRLTFCTLGIMLRRILTDPYLDSVSHVIVDEVHERSEECDLLLLILKNILKKRKDFKVILMSATLKADVFLEYYKGVNNGPVPVVEICGRTFPVHQIFLEEFLDRCPFVVETLDAEDEDIFTLNESEAANRTGDEKLTLGQLRIRYGEHKLDTIKTIYRLKSKPIVPELIEHVINYIVEGDHKWPKTGSILVFLPGMFEIQTIYDVLTSNQRYRQGGKFVVLRLHSNEEEPMIFEKFNDDRRKIILSTNIAETSVTIEDCVFVIDCGYLREKRFNSHKNIQSLELVWETKANALQRKGRAGRVRPGVAIHLFTQHRYQHTFLKEQIPEIKRIPLEQLILRLKQINDFEKCDIMSVTNQLIEPPEAIEISASINRLQEIGALDMDGNLTSLGQHLSALPVDVRMGKLLLFGAMFQCIDSILTIAACLSYKSPFLAPYEKRQTAYAKKRQFSTSHSDHVTVLIAYKRWLKIRKEHRQRAKVFAEENFLSWRTLETISDIKFQFLQNLAAIGFVHVDLPSKHRIGSIDKILDITGEGLNSNGDNNRLLVALLCAALYPNIAKVLTPDRRYVKTQAGAMPQMLTPKDLRFKTKEGYVHLDPSSVNAVVGEFPSPFVLYQETLKTHKVIIKESTMVPIIPLVLFGGNDIEIQLQGGDFCLILNKGWIVLKSYDYETAEMIRILRLELVKILELKIRDPYLNLLNYGNGRKIISTIVYLISKC